VICPPFSADALHARWGSAEITMVDDAGHSAFEPGILGALLRALDDITQA
jgi:proline iminopeptidase